MNLRYIKYVTCSYGTDYDIDVTYINDEDAPEPKPTRVEEIKGLASVLASPAWKEYTKAHGSHLSVPLAEYACKKLTRNKISLSDVIDYCTKRRIGNWLVGDLLYKVNLFEGLYGTLIEDKDKIWYMAIMAIGDNAPCDDAVLVEVVHALEDNYPDFHIKDFI